MKKIKIGQIGVCHEHADGKINTLRKMSDVFEIVGVVDEKSYSTTPRKGDGNMGCFEDLKFMTEEELFQTPGLQAVTVEVPNLELVSTAMRCMERNLAMHMDKPGGDDLEVFAKLRKGIEDKGLPFQMGYMFRGNPAMQWCLKAARNGWLGDIMEIQGSMSHNYGNDAYQEYIGKFPGGIMFNLGCHLIDFVVAMMGAPDKITPFLKSTPEQPDSVKNNCTTIFDYEHAIVSIRACSREIDGLNRRRLKISGTNGSIELCPLERFDGEPLQMRLSLQKDIPEYSAGNHTLDFGIIEDRYESQLLELAKTINGEMDNPYGYEHDYLVQKVLLAASGYTKWATS